MRRVLRATLRPFRISAAMRKSLSLPFVQLPTDKGLIDSDVVFYRFAHALAVTR